MSARPSKSMRWSWRILTVAGIGIYVHATFLLLLIWAGWSAYMMKHSWWDALQGIGFILTLFTIVLLHELGHATTAKRYGIKTKDIWLLPIGGVARLERMPEEPRQELAIALAGPAVNVLLAILFFAVFGITRHFEMPQQIAVVGGSWLSNIIWINLFMVGFNMLPAFPMDGGRVLRALLAVRLDYARATAIAAHIGQAMAVLFGLAGLFGIQGVMAGNPLLVLVAVFVWIGAAQESNFVQIKSALSGLSVANVMITDFKTLAPDDTLERAVEYLLSGYQQDFPVMNDGKLEGLLTRSALVDGLARLGRNMPVADAMQKEYMTAEPGESVEAVFIRLQGAGDRSLPVLQNGQLVGILTRENLSEYLMIHAALHSRAGDRPATDV